jgi:hypothetical protein
MGRRRERRRVVGRAVNSNAGNRVGLIARKLDSAWNRSGMWAEIGRSRARTWDLTGVIRTL